MACDLNDADKRALQQILRKVVEPNNGLPDPVFDFARATVPMVNVDLLVTDNFNRVLLAWREDNWGVGWHIPGGIIRIYESISEAIAHTAKRELGVEVSFDQTPITIAQFFADRGHFISLMYKCTVVRGELSLIDECERDAPRPTGLAWFSEPPTTIYPAHEHYIVRLPQFDATQPLAYGDAPIELR